ncbi:unnamed protein product [Diabrotica balteata]|uniref:Regulatory protein zeste n=1 Tax=Diabrotica balteata TaxID=107213 RepID=A0A9N9T831_DIABA|nr:unnamed protein product [Diabrotica balteata]
MSFKLTEGHWNVLLEFMEQLKEFVKGQFSGPTGRIIQRKLWEELAQLLNSLGEGSKPVEKWQKTWSDIKYSIKRKASAKKQDIAVTGGGPKVKPELNQLEERVINILGKTFYEGVSVSECGIPSTSEDDFLSTSKDVFPQNSLEDTPIHLPVCNYIDKFSIFFLVSLDVTYDKSLGSPYLQQIYRAPVKVGDGSFGIVCKQFKTPLCSNAIYKEIRNNEKVGIHQT